MPLNDEQTAALRKVDIAYQHLIDAHGDENYFGHLDNLAIALGGKVNLLIAALADDELDQNALDARVEELEKEQANHREFHTGAALVRRVEQLENDSVEHRGYHADSRFTRRIEEIEADVSRHDRAVTSHAESLAELRDHVDGYGKALLDIELHRTPRKRPTAQQDATRDGRIEALEELARDAAHERARLVERLEAQEQANKELRARMDSDDDLIARLTSEVRQLREARGNVPRPSPFPPPNFPPPNAPGPHWPGSPPAVGHTAEE